METAPTTTSTNAAITMKITMTTKKITSETSLTKTTAKMKEHPQAPTKQEEHKRVVACVITRLECRKPTLYEQ